jgi:hypothetical protein
MNLIKNIYKTARMIVIPCCMLTACNYLDVIPPAQAVRLNCGIQN